MKVLKTKCLQYLLLLVTTCFFYGCSEQNTNPVHLTFSPNFSGVALNCHSIFNLDNNKWHYQQLQMYISNVELQNTQGEWHSWPMIKSKYQHSNVALIGESCNQIQDKDHWQIALEPMSALKSKSKSKSMSNIRFTLGVPFELNHLNPLTQPSPLNVSSMFWVWQTGHKFLRVELASADDNWLFHLGSTGCSAPSVMRAPAKPCSEPNQVVVELPFNPNLKSINFDLAALLQGINVTMNSSCQSAPDDENCMKLLNNIGVLGQQKVFSINVR